MESRQRRDEDGMETSRDGDAMETSRDGDAMETRQRRLRRDGEEVETDTRQRRWRRDGEDATKTGWRRDEDAVGTSRDGDETKKMETDTRRRRRRRNGDGAGDESRQSRRRR